MYKCKKRQQLSGACKFGRSSNDHDDAIGTADSSWSVNNPHQENGISPTESQPDMREKQEAHLYQALYQGPMLPRRTDHSVETIVIDDGLNLAVGIDEDSDIPPKINLLENFEKLDNGDAQVVYDQKIFLHHGSSGSITNTRDNEVEYEEMRNFDNFVDEDTSKVTGIHDVDF